MSVPPTKILLPSSFDSLGGEGGVISQLDGLFQRLISEKKIDQENQEWFSKDFSYFIRKLKNVKNDKQEIFANSCKIFDLFLEFVEKFGITQNLLKIIANFFDKHIHQSLTPFELDNSTENVLDVENLLKNPKQAEENNTVYFIRKMFSTNVFKMILDYVKSEDSDEVSLLHYLRIVRAIHIHVTNSVNSYIIKSMFKLIFEKELSANSNFIQIIEFIEHFSVFNVVQPNDIIEYLLKVMKTRSSYAGHILSKILLFLTKCDKMDQLADIQECINWALLDTENQGVFNSIRQLMKKYKQYQLIIEKNSTEILFNSKIDDSETIKTNLVLRAIKYYDFNATNFANALIEKPYHSSKLEIYLIEKVDKTISAGLFNLFLKNATDKEIKTAKHYEKNNNLEYHILKAIETAEDNELDNLIKLIFHQKMNGPICTFIERSYSTGKNYQLADAFKPLLGNIKERQTFKLLFNLVCDRMKDGIDDEIFHYATYFIRDWISSGEPSWMQKIIEPLFLIDEIHMSDCLPTFLDSIFERFPQHVRTLNFLLKLVEQTVPVQHCYWLVNAVMNELRHDRTNAREISMFMEILFKLLEDENTCEAAIEMLYHTACINADAKENCLGVTRELVFEHREKVMTTHAVFNPWHTCNRIFLNVSKLYPVLKHYTITVDMPNGKDKVVNQREPITAMPITEDSEIRMRISNNERTDSNQKPPEMTSLAIQMIANFFDTKIDDLEKYAESSTKIQMILVMMGLSDSFFSDHKVDQSQKLIYPHYIHYIAKTKPESLDVLSILEQLGNDSFDPVSTATIVQGLDFLDDKFEVKLSLFRKLIFHQYQCVRKLCTTLIDFTNMQNKLVAMIHEAEVYPCRERCEEFFEILGTLDISKSIFNDAFKDLRQYENGENFDLAFIGLLQLIDQNDENFDLVFQRAFKRPPSDSSNGPFLISHYSRTMAYEWLMSPENREKFAEKCKIIPIITDDEPNTIKYTGHSGIKNIGATCYASVLIQAMNTMPRFVEKLFISNDEKMSRFVFRLRHLLAQVRFLRGAIIDPSPMLLEINNFSAQDQQDACETYSTFISKIDEFDKSILEPITGKLVRTNYSGKMPPSTKEEPFYYLSIRTKGVYNLQEGLKRSFTPETIYNVHLGNDEIGVVKTQFHVEQWPMYLPFMMQRYEYDTTTAQRIKLTNRIEFPIIFTADEINDLTGSKPPNNYELCAVIIHSGTAQSGHYIALVSANGSWYECNDGVVQEIDVSKISELAFGLHEPEKKGDKGDYDFSSMTAYMLFYRMKTEEATDNHVSISPKLLDSLEEEAEQLWPNFIFNSSDLCQTIYQMYNKEPLDEALAELYFLSLFKINASSSRINHVTQKLARVSNDDSTMNAFFRFIDRNLGDNLYKIVESSIGESLIKQVQNYLSKSSEINHFVSFLSHWRMVKDDKEVFILKILKRMLEIEDLDWTQNELAVKSALKILNDVWRFEKTKLSSVFLKTANQLFKVYSNNIECKHIVNNLCEMAQTEMFIPLIRSLKKEETLKMFLKVVIVNFPVILISQNLPDFVYRLIEETYEENSIPAELKDIREFAPGTVEPIIMQATNVLLENNLTSCKDFREGLIKLASLKSSSSTDKPKKRAPVAQPAAPQQQQTQQQQATSFTQQQQATSFTQQQQATSFTQQQLQAFYQQQIMQQQQQFLRHQYMQQQQQQYMQQQQLQLQQQQQQIQLQQQQQHQQQPMILGIYNPQQQTILPAVIATPVIVQNQNLMQNQLQGQSIMQTQQINTQQQQYQNQVHINIPAKTQKRHKNSENEKNGQQVNTELLKIENPLYDIEERITIDPNPTNPPFNVEADPNMEVYKPIQNLPLSVVAKDGPFNYNDGFFPQTIDPVPLESISNF